MDLEDEIQVDTEKWKDLNKQLCRDVTGLDFHQSQCFKGAYIFGVSGYTQWVRVGYGILGCLGYQGYRVSPKAEPTQMKSDRYAQVFHGMACAGDTPTHTRI